jgi:hypothetical protein
MREERRLRVFDNMALRRISWPKRNEVTGEWRKLHNEKFNGLYSSPNTIRVITLRRMRCMRHLALWGRERCVQGFGRETWRKETTWKTRRKWEDNMRMDIPEVGWGAVDWFGMAQDTDRWRAVVNR